MGIYLHVPFCASKCPYCDFYSLPLEEAAAARYVDAVKRALASPALPGRGRRADTVYFGGGTPSLLGEGRLCALLEAVDRAFPLEEGAEVTLEANPGTVDFPLLASLRKGGFNRISMGMQSAHQEELRLLGRRHEPSQTVRAMELARRGGFENLSLDLMLGTPSQTPESALDSVRACAGLGGTHISAYMLKVEPGTPYGEAHMERQVMDGDALADLYLETVRCLEGLGYRQYEISNFARPGYESRHNLKYWRGGDYLGVGPSAHSMAGGKRFFFPRDLGGFIAAADPWDLAVKDGEGGTLEEFIMLRLRLSEGLDLEELSRRWPVADLTGLGRGISPLCKAGYARFDGRRLALTPEGFLVSNGIIAQLLA